MALNKKNEFDEEMVQLSAWAKALSHPARLAILLELAQRKTCICGEIVEVLPLSQSTVSQHLKELQLAGLISGTIDGVRSCYCIHWENFNKAFQTMDAFQKQIKKHQPKTGKSCC